MEESEEFICRPYQLELEEIATVKNTIIHLPTGSGKTFIAIRVINKFRHDLKLPWGAGGKRTFFLVNTIPLVKQQKSVIENLSPVNGVGTFCGEDNVDIWDKSKWDREISKYQIAGVANRPLNLYQHLSAMRAGPRPGFVLGEASKTATFYVSLIVIIMTSQILADMLTHNYIKVEDINLLIFDECHHGVEDHPMRLIMKNFENCPLEKQPRVLGLTATLLNSNVTINNIQSTVRELETTFHATIATVNDYGQIINYSTNPNEHIRYYKRYEISDASQEAIEILRELISLIRNVVLPDAAVTPDIQLENGQHHIITKRSAVKEVMNMASSVITYIEELGAFGGSIALLSYTLLLDRLRMKAATTEEELLYVFPATHMRMAKMILQDSMANDHGFERIVKHSSPKVLALLEIIKEANKDYDRSPEEDFNNHTDSMSTLIFVRKRFTANILYNLLKEVKNTNTAEFGFLKHDYVVGANINPFKNTREQYFRKKLHELAIALFRSRKINCLITTSVMEEGVDISQCSLVVRYDPPMEYRSYIQSKGRARSVKSHFFILVKEEDAHSFYKQYETFKSTEKYIQNLLIGKTENRDAPTDEDIRDGLYKDEDIEPFISPYGHRLSSVSAISLLNRYCSMLPHDQFTTLSLMWVLESIHHGKKGKMQFIKIYMPISCPIKDPIAGIPRKNLKLAKRSAALNACIRLYEEGELDQITLLPKFYGLVDFETLDIKSCFPNWPKEEDNSLPKTGTKKCVRRHEKVFPGYLEAPKQLFENGSQTFYLHVIRLRPVFATPTDSRERTLYEFLNLDDGYGFLTPKPLPKLCTFPIFTTTGEVMTSLEVNFAVIELDSMLFDLVKRFHLLVFDEILKISKKFNIFEGKCNNMYVVPVTNSKGIDIDWQVMQTYQEIPPVVEPAQDERKSLYVTCEDYKYSVVSPWYRDSILPNRYIVSNVIEYMTPKSMFETDGDSEYTYADYYLNKYNLEILGSKDQPMLEVRNITTRMNCLLPRAVTIRSFSEKQQRLISLAEGDDKPKSFYEIFIPEFCIKYEYPGVLWYKATLLPSIIHRVFMLLVAHELRAEIAKSTKYGQTHIPPNEEWSPIEVNMDIATKALLSLIENPTRAPTVDRINNPNNDELPQPSNPPPTDLTVKDSFDQIQKKISKEYPWDENMEPLDIERNLLTATLMDMQVYDEFCSVAIPLLPDKNEPDELPNIIQSPRSAAILAPPPRYNENIPFLSRTPTGRGPELKDILSALTTINSHDTFNLERVETLGDSFLKFAATLFLFHKFPKMNEGQLTNIKCRLIGNRNLYYAGVKVQLGGRMKIEQFSPRQDFLVPGFFAPKELEELIRRNQIRPSFLIGLSYSKTEALSGVLSEENIASARQIFEDTSFAEREPATGAQNAMQCYIHSQAVSDKSIADCVEALIGTYLLSGGVLAAVKVLEWLKVLPPQDDFAQYLHKGIPTVFNEQKTSIEEINRLLNLCQGDVEEIIDYKFKDPSLLLEALSHSSYIRNRITNSYERLEFLGDAILDFLITAYIFENCRELKPGELTDLRSALVNNVTFASYVVKLGLHKFLCYQLNPDLESAIVAFTEHQVKRNHKIEEDVLYLIDEEDCHIADYIEVPKVLSDIFESIIGAIYLDCGGDLERVWTVIYRIMHLEIRAFSDKVPKQPVRVLCENIHACPSFGQLVQPDINLTKVMVPVTFTKEGKQISVYGFGRNKAQAKRAASKLALKVLES